MLDAGLVECRGVWRKRRGLRCALRALRRFARAVALTALGGARAAAAARSATAARSAAARLLSMVDAPSESAPCTVTPPGNVTDSLAAKTPMAVTYARFSASLEAKSVTTFAGSSRKRGRSSTSSLIAHSFPR